MRPNNQNKRSRGRSSGNRKNSNPLSRNYESNGPDVKIRGNAAHIAEKYVQLSRDAHASSDSVMAENYLQHAEHYFRIVSAAQAANLQRSEQLQPQPVAAGAGNDEAVSAEATDSAEAVAPAEEAVTAKSTSQSDEGDSGTGEEPVRKPRERRPRRKPRPSPSADASNPADAPQPDVGDLPAFLTGGGQTDAAE